MLIHTHSPPHCAQFNVMIGFLCDFSVHILASTSVTISDKIELAPVQVASGNSVQADAIRFDDDDDDANDEPVAVPASAVESTRPNRTSASSEEELDVNVVKFVPACQPVRVVDCGCLVF